MPDWMNWKHRRDAGAQHRRSRVPFLLSASCAVVLLAVGLAGCGKFFPPLSGSGSSGGSGGGGGSATGGDIVYVANANTSLNNIAGLSISNGQFSNVANSPYALGVPPTSMTINPAGTLVWVGGLDGNVYVYVVQSNGSLALGNSNGPVASVFASSMAVDPSGNWMVIVSGGGNGTAPQASVFSINKNNGQLTTVGNPLALDNGTATQLVFTPDGTRAFASLGTGGVDSLTFNASSGSLGKLSVLLQPKGNGFSDQGLAVDPASKYLFVAETGTNGVRVLAINSDGTLTENANSPYPTGLGARSVLVTGDGAYVYVANSAENDISAFSLAGDGTLTELAGSPFQTGASPIALTEDGTGTYILSGNTGGSPDLQAFTFAGGTLVSAATASTGSQNPAGVSAVVALP